MVAPDALDPRAARLLHMLRAGEGGEGGEERLKPQDRRAALQSLAEFAADPPPPEVERQTLACPAADGAMLEVRRYIPPASTGAAMLYVHGGGWVAGDLDTHAGTCAALALASGAQVFALAYRRAPENPFPGPLEDVLSALVWLQREAHAFDLDPDRLAATGDSAGANLVAASLLDPSAPRLALQLLICPILDLPRTNGSRAVFAQGYFISASRLAADAQAYLQGLDPADPRASPLRAKSLSRMPTTLIHAAGFDPFRDEALDYAERLRQAGVEARTTLHPGMIHYFYALGRAIPAARPGLQSIGAQVRDAFEAVQSSARAKV